MVYRALRSFLGPRETKEKDYNLDSDSFKTGLEAATLINFSNPGLEQLEEMLSPIEETNLKDVLNNDYVSENFTTDQRATLAQIRRAAEERLEDIAEYSAKKRHTYAEGADVPAGESFEADLSYAEENSLI